MLIEPERSGILMQTHSLIIPKNNIDERMWNLSV